MFRESYLKAMAKVHPRTGREGTEGGVDVYSFFNLGVNWGG